MANETQTNELTVVVTTHNRADVIEEALDAVAVQAWDGDWDVILLDNGSTDHTPELLERWVEKMPVPARVVTASERNNPSYARNSAVAATNARSVAFIDDDDVIADGWVAAIGVALRDHELVASQHDFARLNDPQMIKDRSGQTTALNHFGTTPVVSGGGMGCRLSLWNDVGGSNESFRTGQDIDFALRVAAAGVTPHFCEEATYSVRLRGNRRLAFGQGERMGRAIVRLAAVHGSNLGMEGATARQWCRRWVALGLRIRTLRSEPTQRRWAYDLGHELGRFRGCVTHRKIFL